MARDVEIVFGLSEEVTPEIFIQRIAMACARGGALRPGERVALSDADVCWQVHEPKPFDYFGNGKPILMPHIELLS